MPPVLAAGLDVRVDHHHAETGLGGGRGGGQPSRTRADHGEIDRRGGVKSTTVRRGSHGNGVQVAATCIPGLAGVRQARWLGALSTVIRQS